MKILDIDLDFFLSHKYNGTVTNTKRLEDEFYQPWKASDVIDFLENNCGLSIANKIKGKYFIHHDEVFYYLRQLQEENNFNLKFAVDHIDAHGDLGTGDSSYIYIATEILSKPLKDRAYPDKINGWSGLSAGNYLAFLAACRWLENLTYVNNVDWADDTQWFNLKDFEIDASSIQLKHYTAEQMDSIIYNNKGGMQEAAKSIMPIEFEPEIPFQVVDKSEFISNGKYDYIFLTQSPGFTPTSSDKLIPVIKSYMALAN